MNTVHAPRATHRHVWLGLGLAVLLDIVTPLVWKSWTMRLPADAGVIGQALAAPAEPLFWVMVALFLAQYFNWMAVLSSSDVSYAQPITALSYVAVSLMSVLIMDERFTMPRGAGIGLILAGVWLIGTTPVRTTGPGILADGDGLDPIQSKRGEGASDEDSHCPSQSAFRIESTGGKRAVTPTPPGNSILNPQSTNIPEGRP